MGYQHANRNLTWCARITSPAEQLHNLAKYWCRDIPNMSENGREPDLLILKAIWIIRTYPNLTVPQTMQAAGISMSNSKVPCLQMQVHCCISTAPPVSTTPPPSSIHAGPRSTEITAMISVTENISSTSTTEASINSNVKVPAPKPKQ